MRCFHRAAVMGTLTLGLLLAQQPAHAAGNVLLPSDDDSSGVLSSLGLAPAKKPQPAPAPSGESVTAGSKPAAESDASILPEAGSVKSPPAGAYTPIPASTMPAAVQFTMPTRVIKMPAPQAISYPAGAGLPNSLTFKIADKYVWGPVDISTINTSLGIPANQIPAHCHVSANGTADSDAGFYPFDTGIAHIDTPISYAGNIQGITARAQAVCDLVPLPPNVGYVFQTGDKYTVPLGQTTCPPPPSNAQRLLFNYTGNGQGQCVYQ